MPMPEIRNTSGTDAPAWVTMIGTLKNMAARGATAAAAPATSPTTPKAFICNFCTSASTADCESGAGEEGGATSSVDIRYLQEQSNNDRHNVLRRGATA